MEDEYESDDEESESDTSISSGGSSLDQPEDFFSPRGCAVLLLVSFFGADLMKVPTKESGSNERVRAAVCAEICLISA